MIERFTVNIDLDTSKPLMYRAVADADNDGEFKREMIGRIFTEIASPANRHIVVHTGPIWRSVHTGRFVIDARTVDERPADAYEIIGAWSATTEEVERVRHVKRQAAYETVDIGLVQTDTPLRDGDPVVIYRADKPVQIGDATYTHFARPPLEFYDPDRFTPLEN